MKTWLVILLLFSCQVPKPRKTVEENLVVSSSNWVKISNAKVVKFSINNRYKNANCLGFFISKDLFVTNYHCVTTTEDCKNLKSKWNCKKIVSQNELYEFTLLRMRANVDVSMELVNSKPTTALTRTNFHFKEELCQWSEQKKAMVWLDDDINRELRSSLGIHEWASSCPTRVQKGDSGGPLFDQNGLLVGMVAGVSPSSNDFFFISGQDLSQLISEAIKSLPKK